MPYHGLSSFLPRHTMTQEQKADLVSMPYHGLSSFLLRMDGVHYDYQKFVSMPYHGLSSFLHYAIDNKVVDCILFQCPTTGFLLFYRIKLEGFQADTMFQCPTTGFLLFY